MRFTGSLCIPGGPLWPCISITGGVFKNPPQTQAALQTQQTGSEGGEPRPPVI